MSQTQHPVANSHYAQVSPQVNNDANQEQPQRHCRFCNRFTREFMKEPRSKTAIFICCSAVLSLFLVIVSGGFIVLLPKILAAVCGLVSTRRKKSELHLGIFMGFQIFSVLTTILLGFHGFFSFMLAVFTGVFEVLTLLFAGKVACNMRKELKEKLASSSQEDSSSQPEDDNNSDVVSYGTQEYNAQPQMYPSQPQQQEYKAQQPQEYNAQAQMYPSQPQSNEPAYAPSYQQPGEEQFPVQMGLLREMDFAKTPEERARNVELLQKHNGNIQQVVSEIVGGSQ